jgi:MATE family multidrug resistance protein
LSDAEKIAGIGISTATLNLFTYGVSQGINKALDVLCTQAYGRGDLVLCGHYLNRGRFISLAILVPLGIMLYILAEDVTWIFSRDENVIMYGANYLRVMIPAIILQGQNDLVRKWLIRLRITSIPLWSNIFMLTIHVPIAYLFVFTWEMDYLGAAYATIVSTTLTYFLLLVQLRCREDIQEALFWPSRESFRDWSTYLGIGVPIMIMMTVLFSTNEIIMAFAGMIGSIELATQTEITSITFFFLVFADSITETVIVMTGNLVGENKVPLAKRFLSYMAWVIVTFYIFLSLFLIVFRKGIAIVFSDVDEVKEMLVTVLPYQAIYLTVFNVFRYF